MYSTTSNVAREVCELLGFDFDVAFVSVMRRGGKTYVRGTCGKPHEFRMLAERVERAGYIYTGGHR